MTAEQYPKLAEGHNYLGQVTAEQYPELAEQFNIGKPPALVVLKGVRNDEAWSKKFKVGASVVT